jgi:hypothetical protein
MTAPPAAPFSRSPPPTAGPVFCGAGWDAAAGSIPVSFFAHAMHSPSSFFWACALCPLAGYTLGFCAYATEAIAAIARPVMNNVACFMDTSPSESALLVLRFLSLARLGAAHHRANSRTGPCLAARGYFFSAGCWFCAS